jgi:hypothetical protein
MIPPKNMKLVDISERIARIDDLIAHLESDPDAGVMRDGRRVKKSELVAERSRLESRLSNKFLPIFRPGTN